MKLSELFSKYNISLASSQEDMFLKYFEFLVEENQKYNLTAITEKEEVFFKHFLDSALPISIFKNNASVIDIGSGAGFPAVPLKILKDSLPITMVDSLNKRVNFLNQLCSLLNLKNINPKEMLYACIRSVVDTTQLENIISECLVKDE